MKEKQMTERRYEGKVIRILSQDIRGNINIYAGLTKIKGISWSMSNAICNALKINKEKKVEEMNEDELKKLSEFIKNPHVPNFLLNRNSDFETGKNLHLNGTSLELQTEFDIKRMKKIKSYKGIRHLVNQPVRGQRTKSHFRKNKTKSVGVKKKVKKIEVKQ